MKSSELGVFWMRNEVIRLRDNARLVRRAYKTPFMVMQTQAVATAYEAAADVIERHANEYEKEKAEHGRRDGVGGG